MILKRNATGLVRSLIPAATGVVVLVMATVTTPASSTAASTSEPLGI